MWETSHLLFNYVSYLHQRQKSGPKIFLAWQLLTSTYWKNSWWQKFACSFFFPPSPSLSHCLRHTPALCNTSDTKTRMMECINKVQSVPFLPPNQTGETKLFIFSFFYLSFLFFSDRLIFIRLFLEDKTTQHHNSTSCHQQLTVGGDGFAELWPQVLCYRQKTDGWEKL